VLSGDANPGHFVKSARVETILIVLFVGVRPNHLHIFKWTLTRIHGAISISILAAKYIGSCYAISHHAGWYKTLINLANIRSNHDGGRGYRIRQMKAIDKRHTAINAV
jgi:hypothetical protein